MPEVRALCSAGITRPRRSYDPVRLPPWPSPSATLRTLPSPLTGLPRLPEPPFRRAVPTTPADRAGARVDCFPAHAAFPKWQEGRHPHCHFRGLLRLHSRYGPPDRSAAQGDLCHEAPSPASYPAKPLVSFRTYRQLSGWNPPPLVIRAFGAHCHLQTLWHILRIAGSLSRRSTPSPMDWRFSLPSCGRPGPPQRVAESSVRGDEHGCHAAIIRRSFRVWLPKSKEICRS